MSEILSKFNVFFNNILYQNIFVSIIILFSGFLIVSIIKNILIRNLHLWTKKTKTTVDDFIVLQIEDIFKPITYAVVIYIAMKQLNLSKANFWIHSLLLVFLTIYLLRFITAVITYAMEKYFIKDSKDKDKKNSLKGILLMIRFVVWGVGLVFLLDNLGFKVSSVIAGLGVGGVAVALAAQAILGDLFSYLAIFFDRPFEIGDFIIVGDFLGTVEYVGIKTTRVRSLGGEQVVFSNSDLTNSRVRNYKRMDTRRVVFKLGVTYQTELSKLKKIPDLIKDIIDKTTGAKLDRVHFHEYGDFSLVFEIVYYVLSNDYNKYMDIQQEINFSIKEVFDDQSIEFAYPTQTLYMER